jgi:hypothetical protein
MQAMYRESKFLASEILGRNGWSDREHYPALPALAEELLEQFAAFPRQQATVYLDAVVELRVV